MAVDVVIVILCDKLKAVIFAIIDVINSDRHPEKLCINFTKIMQRNTPRGAFAKNGILSHNIYIYSLVPTQMLQQHALRDFHCIYQVFCTFKELKKILNSIESKLFFCDFCH